MIGQAFRAELFKLWRNRWSLFWAFGFMPVFGLVAGLIEETSVRAYVGEQAKFLASADGQALADKGADSK
jgi:hypothetical protein